jgi:hypothetical protein
MSRSPLLRRLVAPVAFFAVAFLLAGCAKPVGSVTGKVTYQNKTLKGGSVSFVSTDGGQSFSSGIAEDGTYKVPNLQGGSYKVCVDTSSLLPPKTGNAPTMPKGYAPPGATKVAGSPKDQKSGPPPGADIPEGYKASSPAAMAANTTAKLYVAIPEKYSKPDSTDLTYTFKGGSETFDIDLK